MEINLNINIRRHQKMKMSQGIHTLVFTHTNRDQHAHKHIVKNCHFFLPFSAVKDTLSSQMELVAGAWNNVEHFSTSASMRQATNIYDQQLNECHLFYGNERATKKSYKNKKKIYNHQINIFIIILSFLFLVPKMKRCRTKIKKCLENGLHCLLESMAQS